MEIKDGKNGEVMIEMKNRRENNDKRRSQMKVKKEVLKFLGNSQNDEYDT